MAKYKVGHGPYNVYFIQAVDSLAIKIGRSRRHPMKRMRDIQNHNCERLTFLGAIWGVPAETEQALHRHFWDYRIRGEWFRPSPRLLHFIATYTTDRPVPSSHFGELFPDGSTLDPLVYWRMMPCLSRLIFEKLARSIFAVGDDEVIDEDTLAKAYTRMHPLRNGAFNWLRDRGR